MVVAHDWEDVRHELPPASQISSLGYRRCRLCGVEQHKEDIHLWMRVVGYRWRPLVGRCPGTKATAE